MYLKLRDDPNNNQSTTKFVIEIQRSIQLQVQHLHAFINHSLEKTFLAKRELEKECYLHTVDVKKPPSVPVVP